MKAHKLCANISILLKKRLLMVMMAVALSCTGLWAVTYRWTGAAGDGLWSTAGNWESYVGSNNWGAVAASPGSSDIVVIKTSDEADMNTARNIAITLDTDVTIDGLISFGVGTLTISSTNHSFKATTVFVGSSGDAYRHTNAPHTIGDYCGTYIPDSWQGNLSFAGSTTAEIKYIDSSSYTQNSMKNSISISLNASLTITDAWNTGNNDQNGVYGRTVLTNNGTTIVAGDMLGIPECIAPVRSELSNKGAVVVESKLNNITTAYIWTGAAGTSDITTAGNWQNNRVPTSSPTIEIIVFKSTTFPEIPAATIFQVKSINFQKDAKLTVKGSLEINGDFTLSPISGINSTSEGTVESTGKILLSDDYDAKKLTIKCNTLDAKGSLKCKNLEAVDATFNKNFDYDSTSTPKITGTLTFTGNDNQVFQSNAVSPACDIGNIIIDKTGGRLDFQLSPVKITGSVTESATANYADLVFTRNVDLGAGSFIIEKASVVRFDTDCSVIDGFGTKTINTKAEIKGTVTINPHFIIKGNYTDTGTITTNNTISFNGTNQEITASATSKLNSVVIDNGPVKLMSPLSAASLEIKASATLNGNSQTITLSGNFTNAGTFSGSASLKFTDDATISSSGPLSINELITDDTITSAKTLTINSDISVSTLTLKGNSTNTWTITGSKSIILPTASKDQTGGEYIKVADTLLLKAGASTADAGTAHYTCTNSKPATGTSDADYINLLKNGWILKDPKYFVYEWEGSDSAGKNSWANPKNWNTNYVPVKDAKVVIKDGKTDYPEITAEDSIEIGTLYVGESTSSDAKITLSSTNIKLTDTTATAPITNYGTIIYSDSGRITDGTNFLNDASTTSKGTVEYKTGTGTISKTTTAPHYYNLKITSGTWTNTETDAVEAETISLNGGKIGGKFQTTTTGSISFDKDTVLAENTELKTDTISFNSKNITGSDYELTVLPLSAAKAIYVGTTETGNYSITNTDLSTIKVKNLKIGDTNHTGNITINASITGECGLYLTTGGSLTQSNSGAAISTVSGELHLQAAGGIGEITPDKPIEIASVSGIVSAINTGTNDIHLKINNTGTTILGGPDTTLQVIKNDAANGNIKISTAGPINIGGNIQAPNGSLLLSAAGTITNANNATGVLSAKTELTLESNASSNGIGTSTSPISINSDSVIATTSNGSSGNGIHLVSATAKDSKYKISADKGAVSISHNGKLTVDSGDQIKTTNADITLSAKSYEFKNTTSADCGTGNLTITAYNATDKITLVDSDIGKLFTTKELIIGDDNHTGNIELTNSGSTVTLPAKTTIRGKTSDEFTNSATINTNDKELDIKTHLINNGTITGTSADITVNRDYSGTGSFTASSGTTTFNRNVNLSNTDFNANGGTIKFNRTSADSQHTLTVKADGSTTFYNIVITNYLTCAGEFKISKKWTNNGTFTGTGSTVHFTDIVTVGGTKNTTFNNLEIDNGVTGDITSNLTVDGTTTIANGTGNSLTLSGTNSFTGNLILGKTTPSAITGGELTINSNTTVQIADNAACDSLIITAPTTKFLGSLTTKSATQINGSIEIDSGVTATLDQDIKFTGNFTDNGTWTDKGKKIIFNGTGLQEFNPNSSTTYFYIDSAKTSENIKLTKDFKCKDANFTSIVCATNPTIECTNKIIFNGDVSVNNTEKYIKIIGNLETNNAITIAPHLMLDGSFTGDGKATFSKDVYIFSDKTTGISLTPMNITGDLIIDSPRDITTSGTITAKNIVLYRGNIKADANSSLHASKDIILLGTGYKSTNPALTVENEKLSELSYSRQDFSAAATMPDTTTQLSVINNFTGNYQANENAKLHAGKNFYANGVTFTSADSKEWFVDLPDIRSAINGFAEAYNCDVAWSHVRCYSSTPISDDGSIARIPAYNCTDSLNNKWWLFEDFKITDAYTVRDNAIYVEFNHPIRNNANDIKVSNIENSARAYNGIYKDPDCQTAYNNEDVVTKNIQSGNYYFYLKSLNSWKTDATGMSAGGANSTDRYGSSASTVTPFIDYSSNANAIVNLWGKRLSADADDDGNLDSKRTSVTDHTGPVLIEVKVGQESHTPYDSSKGADSQPSYDSHNYIEFRYSEPVNFGDKSIGGTTAVYDNTDPSSSLWLPADAATITNGVPDINNVRVHDGLGKVTSNLNATTNLEIAGLGKIAVGQINTGSNGNSDPYVNSLYRMDKYSIRLSIAGYTDGTVTDRNGNNYKNWIGYIDSAIIPSGNVTLSQANDMITDCAFELDGTTPVYNIQTLYKPSLSVTPAIVNIPAETYLSWDISAPVFAPIRVNPEDWRETDNCEAVGNNSGSGSTLDKIEFHLLDNTPTYVSGEEPTWRTGKGWVKADGETLLAADTYCADIFGGSRPFANTNRSSGGLRYSSVSQAINSFRYIDSQGAGVNPTTPFDGSTNVFIGAKSPLFLSSSGASRNPADPDGLYFGLSLSQLDLPLTRSFTVSYDENSGFITDLAGNRLRSAKIKTIDRNPPSFDIVLSPINQNEVYMVFVKQLSTSSSQLKYIDDITGVSKPINESFESLIPKCFELISIDASGNATVCTENQIDYSIPAKIEHTISKANGEYFTVIRLTLKNKVNLNAVQKFYLRIITANGYDSTSKDPITAISGSFVTFIQDPFGNYMPLNSAHALSDFAISTINPLYAYDDEMTYNGQNIMYGLYEEGSWAVHDWNKNQQNYGTLPANHAFSIVADMDDGTDSKENLPSGVRIYMTNQPSPNSVSTRINSDLNKDYRIWLPEISLATLPALAPVNNTNFIQLDSILSNEKKSATRLLFNVSKEISSSWGNNQQVSFIFGLLDENGNQIKIHNTLYYDSGSGKYDVSLSNTIPLYSLRLSDPSDITSIDLWSIKTRAITEQRGGVTILNNVINPTKGEKTVLKVNVPSEGNVNIMVMTIDGSIITYLNHGLTSAGEHYYYWDGKNKNNGLVARGIYFIRIVGNGFDETRKVMVVK